VDRFCRDHAGLSVEYENQASSGRVHHPGPAVVASRSPSGADWVHEIKHDGYRLTVRRDDAAARLYNRKGNDWTARLPTIAAAAELTLALQPKIGERAIRGLGE
jgi:ATP-dependent DNA ligase